MTDTTTRPPRCHHDRTHGRVTNEHRDDCTTPDTHRGCVPCTAPHCSICGREHLTNAHPQTCAECIGKTREDLVDITTLCQQLRPQAAHAGSDGRLAAAAPIPGAHAMVLIGPSVNPDQVRMSRHWADDHPRNKHGEPVDPIPPLAVLAWWEDTWRTHLGHTPAPRASISGAIGYLDRHLSDLAQTDPGDGVPEFVDFARAIVQLRVALEHALHDEREPERGVECFECGARLVRRHRDRKSCTHRTPARDELTRWLTLGYPEAVDRVLLRDARRPCGRCDQGGLEDPSAGQSWECPACRKDYGPGEYATAVRRSLLDQGDAGDGWTDIVLAAQAATTLTGRMVPASTVRKWMDRGQVGSLCLWRAGQSWGQRLVYWPDVADVATRPTRRIGRAS